MARHADFGADQFPPPHYPPQPEPPRRGPRTALIAAASAAVVVLVAGCLPFVFPSVLAGVRSNLPWFPPAPCTSTTVVQVVAAPLVEPTIASLAASLENRRTDDGSCLAVRVRAQDPSDTVDSSSVLPPSQAPQLWVSDSSLWPARVTKWKQRTVASFASTPVVMVSGGAAVNAATTVKGWWSGTTPSWTALFANARPLSVPDIAGQASGQLALISLWEAAGKGSVADKAVAAAALAAGRSTFQTDDDALSSIVNPTDPNAKDSDAPFVVTTEQEMFAENQKSTRNILTPIYPQEGSAFLDFPIVRIGEERENADQRTGVDAVIAALTSADAHTQAHTLGLRQPDGSDPPTAGQRGLPAKVTRIASPSPADLGRFLARLQELSIPSRILVAVDVSLSMNTAVPGTGGLTRVDLAGKAAAGVGEQLPDTSSAGLWIFALAMDGAKPYRVLAATEPLGTLDNGVSHRLVVQKDLLGMAKQLTGGGTGLYVTALAAVRAQRDSYDPRASNSVVLFTDGTNENDPRMTLPQLVGTLRQETAANPDRPVRLLCIGLGPGIDLPALTAMAEATGGTAYQAITADQLRTVLYDAISRRA